MKKLALVAMATLLLSGCAESYTEKVVDATVIEKDYDAPITKNKRVKQGDKYVTKKENKPAEYDVLLDYEGIQKEYDDRALYNRVKEGGKVKVKLITGYDKEGKVVSERIELIR